MTGEALAARLAAEGLGAYDADGRRVLFDRVLAGFRRRTGRAPAAAWWVPGRLEVFGKHTDYCGGHSLIAAVPRGFVLVAGPRRDGDIHVLDTRRGEVAELRRTPDGSPFYALAPGELPIGWRQYVLTAARRLARNFPGAALGADIVLESDLPPASGMSSSSALVVGIASALVRLGGIEELPAWRENVRDARDAAGYYACIENGLAFGGLPGDAGVGTHGGSEDHVAIVCGRARELSAWRFVPIAAAGRAAVPDGWAFVLAASGVAADKTGSARGAYNRLSRQAAILVELWNRHVAPAASLRDVLGTDASAPARLTELVRGSDGTAAEAEDLERRAGHFLREDARVLTALEAIRRGDVGQLAAAAAASQEDAERLLQNQVPETVSLARRALELGASAASSFGAGFGGAVWALADEAGAGDFAARWLADHVARFPARRAAGVFVARPAPGVRLLT